MTKKEALRKIDIAIQIAASTGTALCKVDPEAMSIAYNELKSAIELEDFFQSMLEERQKRSKDDETN